MRAGAVLPAGSWNDAAIDTVLIDFDRRHRRRIQLRTEAGAELLLDLPQAARLRDGDGLRLEDGRVVEVKARPEPLLDIHAHDAAGLVRIAWHLGNRHLPVQMLGAHIRIRADHVIEEMVRGLGGHVHALNAPFDPEAGAYAGGHQHHHDVDEPDHVHAPAQPDLCELAEHIARSAHRDQVDKAGQPYVDHLERVVAFLRRRWPDSKPEAIAAAWLHDVMEDTPWDRAALLAAGIPDAVVGIVSELTRPANSTYLDWIAALATNGSLSAVQIKVADNEDNSDPARVAALPEGTARLAQRYRPARAMLDRRLATNA